MWLTRATATGRGWLMSLIRVPRCWRAGELFGHSTWKAVPLLRREADWVVFPAISLGRRYAS